jgi:hypothetical protein
LDETATKVDECGEAKRAKDWDVQGTDGVE